MTTQKPVPVDFFLTFTRKFRYRRQVGDYSGHVVLLLKSYRWSGCRLVEPSKLCYDVSMTTCHAIFWAQCVGKKKAAKCGLGLKWEAHCIRWKAWGNFWLDGFLLGRKTFRMAKKIRKALDGPHHDLVCFQIWDRISVSWLEWLGVESVRRLGIDPHWYTDLQETNPAMSHQQFSEAELEHRVELHIVLQPLCCKQCEPQEKMSGWLIIIVSWFIWLPILHRYIGTYWIVLP